MSTANIKGLKICTHLALQKYIKDKYPIVLQKNKLFTSYNKKTLTAEAVKNGLPIPKITFFGCEIVFSSIPPPENSKFGSSTSNFV